STNRRRTNDHPPARQDVGSWSTTIHAAVRRPLGEINGATIEAYRGKGAEDLGRQTQLAGFRRRTTGEDQEGARGRRPRLATGYDVSATGLTDPVRHPPVMEGRLDAEEQAAPGADADHQLATKLPNETSPP